MDALAVDSRQQDYTIALSLAGEQRDIVDGVAEILTGRLGKARVFYDAFYRAQTARPNLDLWLQEVYRDRAQLVVVFLSADYGRKDWTQRVEWRAIRERMQQGGSDDEIMLIRLAEGEVKGVLGVDSWYDARNHAPEEIAELILERLESLSQRSPLTVQSVTSHRRQLRPPGILRLLLDRYLPALHKPFTRYGTFWTPEEYYDLNEYLAELSTSIGNKIADQTYVPLRARNVPSLGTPAPEDTFVRPIARIIRQVRGESEGGDGTTAEIAAVSRRTALVRNVSKHLLRSKEPLVLLGDPGTGKTMTLLETLLVLAESQKDRVFPIVPVYVRLGEFHGAQSGVTSTEVLAHVRQSAAPKIKPWLDALLKSEGRLVLVFDGMDEMSREGYSLHTKALSDFASDLEYRNTKTLFSCRIVDFSPEFRHRRLVLLPFDRSQIARYLARYLESTTTVVDGQTWKMPKLAEQLTRTALGFDPAVPFQLWLFSLFIRQQRTWPRGLVELLGHYVTSTYERKNEEHELERKHSGVGAPFAPLEACRRAWARFAYVITDSNAGSAVAVEKLRLGADPAALSRIDAAVYVGKRCGFLLEAIEGKPHLIRFENHRLQEYFTAAHLHEERLAVNWLERLDAPRWQETMINLAAMGGADEAIEALSAAISGPIREFRALLEEYEREVEAQKKAASEGNAEDGNEDQAATEAVAESTADADALVAPVLHPADEMVFAERVELAARIVSRVGQRSEHNALRSSLTTAVELLVDHGNPITQVKMMRACFDLPNVDVLNALEKPLRSNVHWVRSQALAMLASARGGKRALGSDLPTEMAYDVATGRLLGRWGAYCKAARTAASPKVWWCLLCATVAGSLYAALLLGIALLLYKGTQTLLAHEYVPQQLKRAAEAAALLDEPWVMALAITWTAATLLDGIVRKQASVWLPVMLVAGITPLLFVVIIPALIRGELSIAMAGVMSLFGAFLLLGGVIGLLALTAQLSSTALYVLTTAYSRETPARLSLLARTCWSDSGFDRIGTFLRIQLGMAVLVGVMGGLAWLVNVTGSAIAAAFMWFVSAVGLLPVLSWLGEVGSHLAVLLGVLLAIGAGAAALFGLAGLFPKRVRWIAVALATVAWIALSVCAIATPFSETLQEWLSTVAASVKDWLGSAAAYSVLLLLTVGAAALMLHVLRDFQRSAFRWLRSPYAPNAFTAEAWKRQLESSNPRGQELLLTRSNPSAVGLAPHEYLALLVSVKPLIHEEPAVSVYWEQRAQFQQALAQERKG